MLERLTSTQLLNVARAEQQRDWLGGKKAPAEQYLERYASLREDPDCMLELVYGEIDLRLHLGEQPLLDEYRQRFPDLAADLGCLLELHNTLEFDGAFLSSTEATKADHPTPQNGANAFCAVARGVDEGSEEVLPTVPGYEILKKVGEGGMAVVYHARDLKHHHEVALKMLHGGAAFSGKHRERFDREVKALAKNHHDHIVPIYDVGEVGGRPYFTMEFLPTTLRDRLRAQPLMPRQVAQWVESLARAIHHFHELHIIHRDLKPANVLITTEGQLKISDFGLARDEELESSLTRSGDLIGTVLYMSPEQARGDNAHVGRASDIYALGAILYEMLAGRSPFEDINVEHVREKVIDECPVPPRRLRRGAPYDLETICLKCLRKKPPMRYATAAELADDLARWRAGERILGLRRSRIELARHKRAGAKNTLNKARKIIEDLLATAGTPDERWEYQQYVDSISDLEQKLHDGQPE